MNNKTSEIWNNNISYENIINRCNYLKQIHLREKKTLLNLYFLNSKVDLVILGVGTGDIELSFIEKMSFNINSVTSIDINNSFLEKFTYKMEKNFPSIPSSFINKYFEDLKKIDFKNLTHTRVFLLMGNTIGNFEDLDSFIKNISKILSKGDKLIVGYHLNIFGLKSYRQYYECKAVDKLVTGKNNRLAWRIDYKNQFLYTTINKKDKIVTRKFDRYQLPKLFQKNKINFVKSKTNYNLKLDIYQK